jgi:glycosyltransferase involved in cell wall biosynthesis
LKILIVNNEFPPVGGGAGRASYYLARELGRLGVEVSVLTCTSGHSMDLPVLPGVKIYRVPSWRKSLHEAGMRGIAVFLFTGVLRFASLLLTQRYDLIYYCSSIPAGLLSFLAPHHASVMILHGLDVPGRDGDSFGTIHRLLKPINLQTWRWAGAVTASSANLAESAHRCAPDLPIRIFYSGVDTDIFYPGEPRPPHKPFRIIGVSRLIKLKGFQYLLGAMHELPAEQYHLTLVGRGSYEPELRAMTEQLGIQDRVTFAGFQSHATLPQMMRDSDLFVLPSYGDSYASVFLESMSSGLPTIGADFGGARELIRHGENGWLVPQHDTAALVEAIRLLSQDEALRCRLGETAAREIRESHSWAAYARNYLKLFEEVLANRRKAR